MNAMPYFILALPQHFPCIDLRGLFWGWLGAAQPWM